ncbi:hypothetical protein ABE504_05845 [Paenibacillus oryzisoli]|uniref:hypothetical protein n=1 Tax=Paenibacillus oryzisoli TaxID=1850517 RepID=UPI003D2AC16B
MTLADRSYESVYGEKYTVKIDNLRKQITEKESGIDTFRVINIEAGLGKSVETNRIVREYIESFEFTGKNRGEQHRKFLIVKRFSKDVEDAENKIGRGLNSENRKKILGITRENWSGDWQLKLDELVDVDVIIITHARYVLLCNREEERQAFTAGRHTLIIDERIDFTKYSFSMKIYMEMFNLLPFGLHVSVVEVSRPFLNEMERVKSLKDSEGKKLFNNQIMKTNKPSPKNIQLMSKFQSLIDENLEMIRIEKGIPAANKVREFTDSLEVLYSTNGYFNNGTITACNHNHNLWGVENNIILDANGSIEKLYQSGDKWKIKFIVDRQTFIVDHSQSTFTHINFNASKSKIEELDKEESNEYYSQIVSLIKKEHQKGQRLLIIMRKSFIIDTKNEEGSFVRFLRKQGINDIFIGAEDENNFLGSKKVAVNWFGNVIGKNDWRDFDQCWILGTPNIPMETHVINMSQYSKKYDWRLGLEMIRRDIDKYLFKNDVYEGIRKGYLIGEIYQAIKRIQRNAEPKAKYFVVSNDDSVVKGVVGLLKNIKIGEKISIKIKKKEKKEISKPQNKDAEITLKLLKNILAKPKGEYAKGELCEVVGIDRSNLNKYFSPKNALVKSYIDTGEIAFEHHKILRL